MRVSNTQFQVPSSQEFNPGMSHPSPRTSFLGSVRWALGSLFLLSSAGFAQEPPPPLPLKSDSSIIQQNDAVHPFDRKLMLRVRQGAEWLVKQQQRDLLFGPGINIGFNQPLDPPHYLHQVEACAALGKIGRVMNLPRYSTVAKESLLSLLESTTRVDDKTPASRFTMLPDSNVNRIGSGGALLRAIHELHDPTTARLNQGEELARYLVQCQNRDGTLAFTRPGTVQNVDHVQDRYECMYQGLAINGIASSLKQNNEPWKQQFLRGNLQAVFPRWQQQATFAMLPGSLSGFAELAIQSKDGKVAGAVLMMADKLCDAQFRPEHGLKEAVGGFTPASFESKSFNDMPRCDETARVLQMLCDSYKLAAFFKDEARCQKYKQGCVAAAEFLARCQLSPDRTGHFNEEYRIYIQGAFPASPREAIIRLEDTALATSALCSYLQDVACVPLSTTVIPALPEK